MLSRALRLLVLVAAAGLSNAGAGPAWAQDDELEVMATALKDTTFTLQDGLKAGAGKLHEILDNYGITHTFEVYPGTHTSSVADRFQNHVLPFFSKNLCVDKDCM